MLLKFRCRKGSGCCLLLKCTKDENRGCRNGRGTGFCGVWILNFGFYLIILRIFEAKRLKICQLYMFDDIKQLAYLF